MFPMAVLFPGNVSSRYQNPSWDVVYYPFAPSLLQGKNENSRKGWTGWVF